MSRGEAAAQERDKSVKTAAGLENALSGRDGQV